MIEFKVDYNILTLAEKALNSTLERLGSWIWRSLISGGHVSRLYLQTSACFMEDQLEGYCILICRQQKTSSFQTKPSAWLPMFIHGQSAISLELPHLSGCGEIPR